MLSRPGIGPFRADAIGSRVTAVTFDMRGTALVTGPLYLGFEIGAGGGGAQTAVLQTAPRVTTTDATSVHAVLGGLVGVESARKGPVQLRGELMAGGRLMTFDLAPVEDGGLANTPASLLGAKWMLQPRAKIERWV